MLWLFALSYNTNMQQILLEVNDNSWRLLKKNLVIDRFLKFILLINRVL